MKIWNGTLTESENPLGTAWEKETILAETFADALNKLETHMKEEYSGTKLKLEITKLELVDEVDLP